eukprot:11218719-Lingulodinium_polyedra.AAC.2
MLRAPRGPAGPGPLQLDIPGCVPINSDGGPGFVPPQVAIHQGMLRRPPPRALRAPLPRSRALTSTRVVLRHRHK